MSSGFWSSEKPVVTSSMRHLVARVGGQVELSCQLSPPRSAEHMEVRWFRSDYSQPVYVYRGDHGVNQETAPEYVNRIEFVKEAIGEGKVSLRIHNISISDDGPYQCSFNDSSFSDVDSMNLSVAAFGLKTQIHVQAPDTHRFMLECDSGGWFPQPQMEWRDSKGEVVPHSSISYSQDTARFFSVKMTLLLRNSSLYSITCCIRNTLTGEERQTSIFLSAAQFHFVYIWLAVMILAIFIMLGMLLPYDILRWRMKSEKTSCTWLHKVVLKFKTPIKFLEILAYIIVLVCFAMHGIFYLSLRSRVSISDPLFTLYNSWMKDMAIVIAIATPFLTIQIFVLLWTLKSK